MARSPSRAGGQRTPLRLTGKGRNHPRGGMMRLSARSVAAMTREIFSRVIISIAWRQSQLHNVQIVPLIHACGDLVFAPRHCNHQNGHSVRGYARQALGKLALPCGSLPSSRASPTSWPRSRWSPSRAYKSPTARSHHHRTRREGDERNIKDRCSRHGRAGRDRVWPYPAGRTTA